MDGRKGFDLLSAVRLAGGSGPARDAGTLSRSLKACVQAFGSLQVPFGAG